MRTKTLSIAVALSFAIFTIGACAFAQEKVLYNFGGLPQRSVAPSGQLLFDAFGNLYGTAGGGTDSAGTVFELVRGSGGVWRETILHSFASDGVDGEVPSGESLIFDSAGNLYGTTTEGGAHNVGTVFELSPPVPPATQWTENVLYDFLPSPDDGQKPFAGLVMDAAGNLYGTTIFGGRGADGTVFELAPNSDGSWTESILHEFKGPDGYLPMSTLALDSAGNLYGTTSAGGAKSEGTVFELSPSGGGKWSETVLYSFLDFPTDGYSPSGGVIRDSAGNLYGVTANGGLGQGGTVYQLSQSSNGSWSKKTLYAFAYRNKSDGTNPTGNLVLDSAGNLYGTTSAGDSQTCRTVPGCGMVFELKPTVSGWVERILHSFVDNGVDGYSPAGLILDPAGNLYGSTPFGGKFGGAKDPGGTVFEIRH